MRRVMMSGQVPESVISGLTLHSVPANLAFLACFSAVMVGLAVVSFSRRG
ncbi:MAG: hypothetical protein ABIJ46_01880 [bacterium]